MRPRTWASLLVSLGTVILGSAVWHLAHLTPGPEHPLHLVTDVVLIGGSGLALVYGGYWYGTHESTDVGYLRLSGWVLGSVLLFSVVDVLGLYLGSTAVLVVELVDVVHLAGSVGAAVGLLVGTIEARAISNSRAAARSEAKAEALARERQRIRQVNELLRHHVLNSLTVIRGNVEYLGSHVPDDETRKLDVIEDRIETIGTLIDHIRTLSRAFHEETPRTEYSPTTLVEDTIGTVAPPQRIDVDVPASLAPIYAPVAFERALRLLFEALTDVLDSTAALRVTAREADDTITLTVETERNRAVTRESVAAAGAETDVKFTIAREFVDSTGRFRLGTAETDSLVCELTLDAAG